MPAIINPTGIGPQWPNTYPEDRPIIIKHGAANNKVYFKYLFKVLPFIILEMSLLIVGKVLGFALFLDLVCSWSCFILGVGWDVNAPYTLHPLLR